MKLLILLCQKWNSGLGLRSLYKEKPVPHQLLGYPKYSSYKKGRLNVRLLLSLVSNTDHIRKLKLQLPIPSHSQAK